MKKNCQYIFSPKYLFFDILMRAIFFIFTYIFLKDIAWLFAILNLINNVAITPLFIYFISKDKILKYYDYYSLEDQKTIILNKAGNVYSANGRKFFFNTNDTEYTCKVNGSLSVGKTNARLSVKNKYRTKYIDETSKINSNKTDNDTILFNVIYLPDYNGLFTPYSVKYGRLKRFSLIIYFIIIVLLLFMAMESFTLWLRIVLIIISSIILVLWFIMTLNEISKRKTNVVIDVDIYIKSKYRPLDEPQDSNNKRLETCQSSLEHIKRKVDSYMIESGLFGALAFSGFVQLFFDSNTSINLDYILTFFNKVFTNINNIVLLDFKYLFPILFVSFSLFSTLLFLLVVASRLSFSDLFQQMESSLNIARSYNQKEDEMDIKSVENNAKKCLFYNEEISDNLNFFEDARKRVDSVIRYMTILRAIAIFSFLLVVLSGAFLLNIFMGFIFVIISIFGFVTLKINKIKQENQLRDIKNIPYIKDVPYIKRKERKFYSRRSRIRRLRRRLSIKKRG